MARPVIEVLGQIDGGAFVFDLNERFAEMVMKCSELGKAGEMKLTLKVKPNGQNSVGITESVAFKVPEPTHGVTMFFVSPEDGSLSRDDPRQKKLDLRTVGGGQASTELKQVGAAQPVSGEPLKEIAVG